MLQRPLLSLDAQANNMLHTHLKRSIPHMSPEYAIPYINMIIYSNGGEGRKDISTNFLLKDPVVRITITI